MAKRPKMLPPPHHMQFYKRDKNLKIVVKNYVRKIKFDWRIDEHVF